MEGRRSGERGREGGLEGEGGREGERQPFIAPNNCYNSIP